MGLTLGNVFSHHGLVKWVLLHHIQMREVEFFVSALSDPKVHSFSSILLCIETEFRES